VCSFCHPELEQGTNSLNVQYVQDSQEWQANMFISVLQTHFFKCIKAIPWLPIHIDSAKLMFVLHNECM
jgi:hypothetical protein